MSVDIVGTATISIAMAVLSIFLVQAIKQAIPETWHRYIPIPLLIVLVAAGGLLAWLQGGDMVSGGIEGLFGAALAVYGYEFYKSLRGPVQE